jgi:hypothetical protein
VGKRKEKGDLWGQTGWKWSWQLLTSLCQPLPHPGQSGACEGKQVLGRAEDGRESQSYLPMKGK